MEKRSLSNRWELIKLRLMLLRIWFVKNLVTFIKIGLIVILVLMLTGQVTSETPILGSIIYPLFQPLIDSINEVITTKNANSFMSFASVALSILITVTIFTIKMQSIAQNDIKNKELKMAMVKAGLYFNENGKMVKKVEQAIGVDIDGDGKSDEKETTSTGLFTSIKNAIGEFITVMKTDLPEESTAKEAIDDAAKTIDAEDTNEALKEIDKIVITSALDRASEIIDRKVDSAIEQVKEDAKNPQEEEEIITTKEKIGLFNRIRSSIKSVINTTKSAVTKEEVVPEEDTDASIITTDDETSIKPSSNIFNVKAIDSETTSKTETKKETQKKASTVITPTKETTVAPTKTSNNMDLVRARYR